MKQERKGLNKLGIVSLLTLLIACSSVVFADSQYKYAIKPGIDIYFGHISYIENEESRPIVYKEDQVSPEFGILNFPIAPGNTIRTQSSGRCEVQFDTGTLIRLEEDTEIKLETVLAQSLSSRKKMTNLFLKKGQIYVMYRNTMSREIFQIMTPKAALKMDHNSVAFVKMNKDGSTDISVVQGKAFVLYGPDKDHLAQEKIKKSQIIEIGKNHKLSYLENKPSPDFRAWNQHLNQNFEKLHEGLSALPKPLHKYPDAVIYFAQKYSTTYGEWLWDDFYGYVWKPYVHKYQPYGWCPYYHGQWTSVNGQMFWIPQEPWGWAPYHLGVWQWDKKKGWVWIPGSAFSPAWVCWNYVIRPGMYTGYFAWRPWTVLDWVDWSFIDFTWMHDAEDVGIDSRWNYSEEGIGFPIPDAKLNQLEKKTNPPYILAGNLKKVFKNVKKELEKGKKEILLSYSYVRGSVHLVKHDSITSPDIQNQIKSWDEFGEKADEALSRLSQKELQEKIAEAYKAIKSPPSVSRFVEPQKKFSSRASTKYSVRSAANSRSAAAGKKTNPMRFRDWNPDVKTAQKMGVSILYSGSKNEIICPELRLSSRDGQNYQLSRVRTGRGFSSPSLSGGKVSVRGIGSSNSGIKTSASLTSKTASSKSKSSKTEKK